MGDWNRCGTDEKRADIQADVRKLAENRQSGGDQALYSMVEDLMLFTEMIDMLRCIIRIMQITGNRFPKGLADMDACVADIAVSTLEKWDMFMEHM